MSVACRKIIVVLGMHRSGTSVITRGLEALGVSLGTNLMPPAAGNNDKGFFEDLDIQNINTQILASCGTAWDHLEPEVDDLNIQEAGLARFDEAVALLRGKIKGSSVFTFKDPQTSLLLPFWRKVFERLALDVHFLICLRNPLSVSASLFKRDGIDPARGYLLWARYQLAALSHTQALPRLVVSYDAVIDAPAVELQRMAKAFGLPPPEEDQQRLAAFCEEFLTSELRHTHFCDEKLADTSKILPQVYELYLLLRQAAEDRVDLYAGDIPARIEQITVGLRALLPLTRSIDLLDRDRLHLQGQLDRYVEDIEAESLRRLELIKLQSILDKTLREVKRLDGELIFKRRELSQVYASLSWQVTRPLRALRAFIRDPSAFTQKFYEAGTSYIWHSLPISGAPKQRLKHALFTHGGVLFSRTRAYRNWKWMNEQYPLAARFFKDGAFYTIDEPVQALPLLDRAPPFKAPAKLIAFYLPQFHAIKENNKWWGDGFTEWTNVEPAQPLYEGHYQPHVPSDLGYYNLEDVNVQRQQVELAKRYGLGGFCFYFYWFGGKRLLETPVENYLNTADLDLPFCLCWANENWSRRWDGLDSHILIGQEHSEDDDLAFIAYVAKYMRDKRYIRINGKPVLLVYRPGLLPDALSTAQRWRTWCRDNGIGEIFLAYTQSFDIVDPAIYGFDAAVEFPPNATQPPNVSEKVKLLDDEFAGQVHDWTIYLDRSAQYAKPPYKLFRGVCPSWDNTARRKKRSTSFINSSPRGYQEWLYNAIRNTVEGHEQADERLVFINAWNEWAEGAHLEPDQRYGYGYLEATRMASLRVALQSSPLPQIQQRKLAVVIHAFYPDVFEEILGRLQQVNGIALKLFVSCPPDRYEQVHDLLKRSPHTSELVQLPNRGRDVLPFLRLLPKVVLEGFDYLLKVHTKKSEHRADGDVWRNDLYEKLLSEQAMHIALDDFNRESSIGVLGPDGHLVPMSYYWGSNAVTVEKLACRLGMKLADIEGLKFVAGTMFFAQVRALEPLLSLALREDDFEAEAGQVDGTLAHALERAISISALAAGCTVGSRSNASSAADYPFADASPGGLV